MSLRQTIAGIEARIEADQQQALSGQLSRITQAGGTAAFLSTEYPRLAKVIPLATPPEALAVVTTLDYWEKRLAACEGCREGEGCVARFPWQIFDRGKTPTGIRDREITAGPCAIWQERVLRDALMAAGVGRRFLGCRFENYRPATEAQRAALLACRGYAAGFRERPEPGLFLAGPAGTGKTHLAVAVAAGATNQAQDDVRMVLVPRLLAAIRESFGRNNSEQAGRLLCEARTAELLILDDLGAERVTEWVREQLFLLIHDRYESMRPVVVTTNDTPETLEEQVGPRIVSRLMEMTRGVAVDGPDHRKRGLTA